MQSSQRKSIFSSMMAARVSQSLQVSSGVGVSPNNNGNGLIPPASRGTFQRVNPTTVSGFNQIWRRIKDDDDSQSPPAAVKTSRVPELQDVRRSVMLNNSSLPPTNGGSTTRNKRNQPRTTRASNHMNGVLKELMKQQ